MEKLHIVHLMGTLKTGGVQKLVLSFARSQAMASFQHSVICISGIDGELKDQYREAGVRIFDLSIRGNFNALPSYRLNRLGRDLFQLFFPVRLANFLSEIKADLVHTHVPSRLDLQAKAISKTKLPCIVTLHSLYEERGQKPIVWKKASRSFDNRTTRITAVSSVIKESFLRKVECVKFSCEVINPGADILKIEALKTRRPEWRLRWEIPAKALVFGALGRLVPVKGYDVFIQAAAELKRSMPDAYFAVAAQGPLKEELETQIKTLGLEKSFYLVGLQDAAEFLRQVDVFVMPSRVEGFPLALIEALAAGLPCIASHVGGIEELLGENGLLIKPDDPKALAGAMQEMLSEKTRTFYGEKGPAIARRHSIESSAQAFTVLYKKLIPKGQRKKSGQ